MLYDIRLLITYAFDSPTGGGRHLLRLLPAAVPGAQRLLRAEIEVRPAPREQAEFSDFFGNRVVEVALPPGQDEISFSAIARLERSVPVPGPDRSVSPCVLSREIATRLDLGPDSPHHFLGSSPRIRPSAAITIYAAAAIESAATLREATEAFGLALHRDMEFDPEATTVDTPPDEAFARRSGVCQDFAQIMIAGLRGLGIPAAYVSGFLRTVPPEGKPRLEGADAMHAWVRVWCGTEAGWVEYDPTNAMFAGSDHVTVAHGRDYGDVAPVAGVLRLAGAQTSRQAVDVIVLAPKPAIQGQPPAG